MTIITLEIDKDNDLSAVKELAGRLGLKYHVNNAKSLYTDEFKVMLDQRYDDYLKGAAKVISEEESRERIQRLLASDK